MVHDNKHLISLTSMGQLGSSAGLSQVCELHSSVSHGLTKDDLCGFLILPGFPDHTCLGVQQGQLVKAEKQERTQKDSLLTQRAQRLNTFNFLILFCSPFSRNGESHLTSRWKSFHNNMDKNPTNETICGTGPREQNYGNSGERRGWDKLRE